ncbi:Asp-tRNA(Asn)/Glu-tRNA(Gln) amidotransferase subunit GatA [Peptoniphilus equinus]|uniref:Glutamyl-tRNA(Gln) amidotransferase subunit A n=1 Tax=Peptoniphilus equinus TaxID=3016343 RepID=A0ABY7QV06_9FIRM|nr:Asp-tRNA(Asn)/Glu-tRNA(Gln) amidotransferase subunit GatA [Peptoniphilus equinus]WBW50615.1 Asp-tRNA(Asn)/Glu-tRNA(Gln) amidotransferase subunit GatA [Peptoniphilus equinus]
MDLTHLKAHELIKGYENRDFTCTEVTQAYLDVIKAKEQDINAYITVTDNLALSRAQYVDSMYENREEQGLLAGVPLAIKDNVAVKDVKMTAASKILENFIAPYNSTLTEKVNEAGAIILGKANMDEFAMGATTRSSYFGATKNPLDPKLIPGGSSGGSAAAVSGFEACLAVGTDTGGSTRQPAGFNGIVGFKPTYGSVSRFGIASMANTFDTVGSFGRDVEDAHLLMQVMAGRDMKDATSIDNPSLTKPIDFENGAYLKDIKVAVPKVYLNMELDSVVKSAFDSTIALLKDAGATVDVVDLENLEYTIQVYHILVNSEIASNMSRFDSLRYGHRTQRPYSSYEEMFKFSRSEGFGDEVKKRIMVGTHILSLDAKSNYYQKALQVRTLIKKGFDDVFKNYDLILSPSAPILPIPLDSTMSDVEIYQSDLFTIPANMAGCPSISVPYTGGSFPVGMLLTADRLRDDMCFKAASEMERRLK